MSAPPSVSCPEPIPYSDDISGYAEIDFKVAPPAVQSKQPSFVPIDSILSNQLGPITNPVQSQSVSGFPSLPEVGSTNDVTPLLSSYSGSEINASMTLSSSVPSNVSVNDIVSESSKPVVQPVVQPTVQPVVQPTVQPVPQPAVAQNYTNVPKPIIRNKESFNNMPKNNLAKYINNKPRQVEHFNKPRQVEHFHQMTLMDNVILAVVIGAFIYFVVSHKSGDNNLDVSKVPIVSQLADKNVSTENKIIIVLTIVIACVLINRMLK